MKEGTLAHIMSTLTAQVIVKFLFFLTFESVNVDIHSRDEEINFCRCQNYAFTQPASVVQLVRTLSIMSVVMSSSPD